MIYTCTLNPSVDHLVEINKVELGSLNRATNAHFYPGGKGINVSRVLKNLGERSIAIGFAGGFTGEFIRQSLENEGISQEFIMLEDPTRINIKLKTNVETEINSQGGVVPEAKAEELLQLVSRLKNDDLLIVAGSLPPGVDISMYEQIASICEKQNVQFVVDTSGKAMQGVLKHRPFFIKPNSHELGEFFNTEIHSVESALIYGKKLLEEGPENVIVSLGAKGAVFINKEFSAYANVPKGELKSSVGAGDSLVAGFIASYTKDKDYVKAFRYGIAAGSATAFSANLCNQEIVESLLPYIKVEQVHQKGEEK